MSRVGNLVCLGSKLFGLTETLIGNIYPLNPSHQFNLLQQYLARSFRNEITKRIRRKNMAVLKSWFCDFFEFVAVLLQWQRKFECWQRNRRLSTPMQMLVRILCFGFRLLFSVHLVPSFYYSGSHNVEK